MSAEFVGIELDLRGAKEVENDLKEIDRIINSLNGKKKLDMGLAKLKKDLVAARGELEQWQRIQQDLKRKGLISEGVNDHVIQAKRRVQDLNQAVREVQASARTMGDTFKQTFNKVSSVVTHIGSKMQSVGNALTRLTTPFANFTKGVVMGAGYRALGSFTEGLERGFTRYDTMKKYPKIMAAFGYSAEQAQKSITALDLSVRGLPTGLDEMVDLAQRFTATTGDIEKGTKLAIATNNAFLASMSTDTQRYQGMMQLQDVLGGKDMNAREWNSLVSSMTPAIVKMGESLGYTKDNMSEFIQTVRDGKMDNQEFINQLIKIGNEGGVLEAMAKESKNTWQAFFANVGNASARMTAGILNALDTISQMATGKDVNLLFADTIIPGIDKATKSIQNWIKAHPEEITDFFKTMGKIKWGSIAKGAADALMTYAKLFEQFGKMFGGKDLSAIGKFMIYGNALGKAMTIIGGITKGSSGPIATVVATIRTLRRASKSGGIMGALGELFGGKGKTISDTASEMGKASGSMGKFSLGLSKWFKGWAQIATAVGGTAFVGFVSFKAFKSMIKDLGEMVDLVKGIDWKTGTAVLGAMGGFITGFIALGSTVGGKLGLAGLKGEAILGALTTFATAIFAADMKLIKSGFKSFSDSVSYLKQGIDSLKNLPDISGVDGIKERISNAIEVFNEITTLMQPNRNMPGIGETQGGLKTLGKGTANSLKNVSDSLKHIISASRQLNKLASVEIPEGVVSKVKNITKVVNNVIKAMPTLTQGGMQGPKNLLANTKSLANAFYQIRRMAYSINKLAATDVNTGGFSTFIANLKQALESLKSVSGDLELNVTVKLNAGFKKSVDKVINQINNAKRDIRKTKKGISITIPVSVTFSVSTNLGSALSRIRAGVTALANAGRGQRTITAGPGQATGGMIYRAGGGGIPNFKRRGTDTVPTMLTPGEYVHNKRAVNMFGIDFMRKVNNLDMKGAMHELMTRAGGMVGANRTTTINNYYNNNQKVTQNINTNSPDFAFRAASRFVGAF